MSRKIYDENGIWTSDGAYATQLAAPFIKQAFEAIEAAGFNPREAQHAIEAEVTDEGLGRMIERKAALEAG